jgi:hypothetical protein
VNLDYDDKVKFIEKFGKDELSKFLRQQIHQRLEEEERRKKGIGFVNNPINVQFADQGMIAGLDNYNNARLDINLINESLDKYIQYFKQNDELEQFSQISPKVSNLHRLVMAKYLTMQKRR